MKISVIHQDTDGNELMTSHEGYFEVNYGGCLVITKDGPGTMPIAIYAKPFWIGASYVEV